jgi:hypothetical protein
MRRASSSVRSHEYVRTLPSPIGCVMNVDLGISRSQRYARSRSRSLVSINMDSPWSAEFSIGECHPCPRRPPIQASRCADFAPDLPVWARRQERAYARPTIGILGRSLIAQAVRERPRGRTWDGAGSGPLTHSAAAARACGSSFDRDLAGTRRAQVVSKPRPRLATRSPNGRNCR